MHSYCAADLHLCFLQKAGFLMMQLILFSAEVRLLSPWRLWSWSGTVSVLDSQQISYTRSLSLPKICGEMSALRPILGLYQFNEPHPEMSLSYAIYEQQWC